MKLRLPPFRAVLLGALIVSLVPRAAPASDAGAPTQPVTKIPSTPAPDKTALTPTPGKSKTAKPVPAAKAKDTLAMPAVPKDTVPPALRVIGQKALQAPEKLLFDVIWGGWNFRWIHAGRATLELLPTAKSTEWQIRSLAWCNKFFQAFYPVHDTVTSLIDHRGLYPLRFEKRLHEGGYHARISATYDQAAHTLATQDTLLSIDPFTHDVLSAFYFIRTLPLKVGGTYDLAAVSGKKKYNLRVLCHGREKIKVPAGEFQTLIVEPVLKGDGLFKAKGKLTIWVTDDVYHTPVKMQSKIPVGSIKAELVSKS